MKIKKEMMMSAVGASTSTAAVNGNNQIFTVSGSEGVNAENDSARQGAFKVRKIEIFHPCFTSSIALELFYFYF